MGMGCDAMDPCLPAKALTHFCFDVRARCRVSCWVAKILGTCALKICLYNRAAYTFFSFRKLLLTNSDAQQRNLYIFPENFHAFLYLNLNIVLLFAPTLFTFIDQDRCHQALQKQTIHFVVCFPMGSTGVFGIF